VFQQFAKDFGAKPLNLYQNFRAQPLLRRMQNAMVRVMDPAAAVPDDELKGAGGSIEIVPSANDREEAEVVVDRIEHWIGAGTPLSEIAVLVPRQPELYTQQLALELSRRGVPFRNEQALQDLATEPVALLIVDFLRVVMGEREFDAYGRLMDVLLSTGIDEDQAYSLRSGWHRFLESSRNQMASQEAEATRSAQALIELSNQFLSMVGKGLLSGLSADYEQGSRLLDVISQTYERISELLLQNPEPINALSRFSAENTVRIMTIHKSKGLEFDSVVMMGVERTTYWGKIEDERSVFFVGISRAKKRLVLTVVGQRGRPENFSGRWDVQRLPHEEFLGYAHNLKR
jgi:superfamily I DNA/RNA helicase